MGHPNASHPCTMVVNLTAFPLLSEQWPRRRRRESSVTDLEHSALALAEGCAPWDLGVYK